MLKLKTCRAKNERKLKMGSVRARATPRVTFGHTTTAGGLDKESRLPNREGANC